jgi:hypothetical protein
MLDRSEKGRVRNLAAVSENGWDVCVVSCFLPIVVPMYRYRYRVCIPVLILLFARKEGKKEAVLE